MWIFLDMGILFQLGEMDMIDFMSRKIILFLGYFIFDESLKITASSSSLSDEKRGTSLRKFIIYYSMVS